MGREKREPLGPALSIGAAMNEELELVEPVQVQEQVFVTPFIPAPAAIIANSVTTVVWICFWWYFLGRIGYRHVFRFLWLTALCLFPLPLMYYYPIDAKEVLYALPFDQEYPSDSPKILSREAFRMLAGGVVFSVLFSPWPLEKDAKEMRKLRELHNQKELLKMMDGSSNAGEVDSDPEVEQLQEKLNQLREKRKRGK